MKQLKISLPDELRAKLDEAAGISGNSVAEEIRSRVEQTFQTQRADDETQALIEALQWLARHVYLDTGAQWHQHRLARMALLDAIREYMLAHQQNDLVEISADAQENAGVIGRAFARAYIGIEQLRRERLKGEP
jgi:hypothetical protein